MIRTTIRAGTFTAAPRPVVPRVVRGARPTCSTIREQRRPAWSGLYTIALAAGVGLIVVKSIIPEGLVRTLADLVAILVCLVLVRLWIKANRWNLVHAEAEEWMQPGEEAANPRRARRANP